METTIRHVDLGHGSAVAFELPSERWAIVLPGAGYTVQAPLLWYAREAALAAGRSVLAITDTFDRDRDDPRDWVRERASRAFDHLRSRDANPVIVAKSLSSLAAPLAAEAGLAAIWLTPLIAAAGTSVADNVLEGLRAARAPQLLIGGTADPAWSGEIARSLPGAEVLELADADHALQVAGDPAASLINLERVVVAVGAFLASLES